MIESVAANLESYLTLLSVRQRLVASNIANADTPGYRTKDASFQSELLSVIEVPGLYMKNDGNNVSLDRESRLLAENALQFNVASNLVRSELRQVRMAIEEGKSS
jgi:flagellar basal-body rod protein FlgB